MADDLATRGKDRSKMKRRTNQAQLEARRRAVEEVMKREDWTLKVQQKLADAFGVCARMIREDAKHVRQFWAESISFEDRTTERAGWLMRVRSTQAEARQVGNHSAAAKLYRLEANVLGLDNPVQVEVTHRAELLNPVEQARAIVNSYEDASAYLESVEPGPVVIDVESG